MAWGQRGAPRLGRAFLLAAAVLAAPAHATERVASAIVFAVDVSGSVDDERYEVQRAGIASVLVNARYKGRLSTLPALSIVFTSLVAGRRVRRIAVGGLP